MDTATYIYKRQVNILHHLILSTYNKVNQEHYAGRSRILGASQAAENAMFARQDMLNSVMPEILHVSTNSANWYGLLQNYFSNTFVEIPANGKELNTSLVFEIDPQNEVKKKYVRGIIEEAKKKNVEIKSSKDLAEYIDSLRLKAKSEEELVRIEDEIWKYAKPENIEDYVLWRYCWFHGEIANNKMLIGKSPKKIKFYLEDELDRDRFKKEAFMKNSKINKLLVKMEEDEDLSYAMCSMLGITATNKIDMAMGLQAEADNHPDRFVELAEDNKLQMKANIQRMIDYGVLRKLVNSGVIVDAEDSEIILGNSYDEVITYFNYEKNKAKVSELKNRYNHLKKTKGGS